MGHPLCLPPGDAAATRTPAAAQGRETGEGRVWGERVPAAAGLGDKTGGGRRGGVGIERRSQPPAEPRERGYWISMPAVLQGTGPQQSTGAGRAGGSPSTGLAPSKLEEREEKREQPPVPTLRTAHLGAPPIPDTRPHPAPAPAVFLPKPPCKSVLRRTSRHLHISIFLPWTGNVCVEGGRGSKS